MKTVEIFDDENTILLNDEYDVITLDFLPNTKEFKSTLNIKADVYERNELYEYKLSVNPIEVFIRLKERSDEPPLRYVVKDNVVLESEMKEDYNSFPVDFIDGLKKDTEWHKLELPSSYFQIFYILSKHPEIISKEDYKRFLRETDQRIKLGLSKIEKRLKEKDDTGLEIFDWKYGKQIWYPKNKKVSEKEREYVKNNFYKLLFEETSSEYCGISKYEFEGSSEILKHIDKLLNEKESSSSNEAGDQKQKKSYWHLLSYAWTFIANLITVGVILAIYDNVYESFEKIAVSILILIYLSLQSFSMTFGKTITETFFALDTEFKRIRKLLKNEPSKYEMEEIEKVKKQVRKATIKMYINAGFLFIIYMIAIFHIFGAL